MGHVPIGDPRAILALDFVVFLAPILGCGFSYILVSNGLERQAVATCSAAKFSVHRVAVRTITLRIISRFRMQATSASFLGFPAATRRV